MNKAPLVGTKTGAYIVRNLRRVFAWWPPRAQVRREAFLYKEGKVEYYKCRSCNEPFPRNATAIDHIEPVVGASGIVSWDSYINNLYCGVENLQVLCKGCHRVKTNRENAGRAQVRRRKAGPKPSKPRVGNRTRKSKDVR